MKVRIIVAPVLLVVFASLYTFLTEKNTGNEKYSTLVWSDEFDYTGFPDSNQWSYDIGDGCPNICGWGNEELEYYTKKRRDNAYVSDGTLKICLKKESYKEREYTSARLTTKGKGDWKYGRFEIRAKLPGGLGTWPAIWMLPTDWVYGGWPRSGEIDIMEKVGYATDTIVASAHTEAYNHGIGTHKNAEVFMPDNEDTFHTYVLEWDSSEYRVYVDDTHFFTFVNEGTGSAVWPYDQKFHLIMNIAYGGLWGGKMGLDDKALPVTMEVDYVRVYQ